VDNLLYRILTLLLLLTLSFGSKAKEIVKDPTRPGISLVKTGTSALKKTVKPKQRLSAIFIKRGKRQAIIDDKLYQKGDYFSGKRIIAIKSNKVVLQNTSGISHLTLTNPIKKQKKP